MDYSQGGGGCLRQDTRTLKCVEARCPLFNLSQDNTLERHSKKHLARYFNLYTDFFRAVSKIKAFFIFRPCNGFTLAEVLITLGIIGIIAAMTLPTLIANYQKKQTAVRVKKVYSELTQAIRLSEAEHGDFKYWEGNEYPDFAVDGTRILVNKYIKPYFHNLKECGEGDGDKNTCGQAPVSSSGVQYVTGNGTALSIIFKEQGKLYILVDLNPKRKSDYLGSDMGKSVFYFTTENYLGRLMPSGWVKGLTREMALRGYTEDSGFRYSCKKVKANEDDIYTDFRHSCTALLMIDGWEFKDDYPW